MAVKTETDDCRIVVCGLWFVQYPEGWQEKESEMSETDGKPKEKSLKGRKRKRQVTSDDEDDENDEGN